MSLELLEAAKRHLPDSLVARAAMSLGENELNIRKGLKGAVPAILAGLLHQSSRSEGSGIMDLLKNVASSRAVNNLTDLLEPKKNSSSSVPASGLHSATANWLRSIFGAKRINIVNAISIYAEIKSSTANTILNIATPAVLTPIAQYAEENNLGLADIDSLLQSQKASILGAIPSGFNLTGSLAINSLDDIGTKIVTAIPEPAEHPRNITTSSMGKWAWPLLLLLTFGGLVWFFSKEESTKTEAKDEVADTTTKAVVPIPPVDTPIVAVVHGKLDSVTLDFIYDQGNEIELKLPDNSNLKTGENSTEAKLFKMLSDTSWKIDTIDKTKNWVTLDRVYFKPGKSVFTRESQVQIKNIAIILKNFPASAIKIGGYTDNAGDSVVNKNLSDRRAKTIMQGLMNLGVARKQITEVIGYGPEHPVCAANDTPECKARNRRVDLKVSGK